MSVVSFLKCLTLMDLSLAMKDVRKLSTSYKKWVSESEPFLRQHGMLRDFMKISNRFVKDFEFTESYGSELAASIKSTLPKFVADTSISHAQLALLKDLSLFMRKDSGPAWTRISKNVSMLNDNTLSAMFLDEDETSDVADLSVSQAMEKIVYTLTGRKSDPILSYNEVQQNKAKYEKLLTKYSDLRKTFKANYTKHLLKFVRLSGKPTVDVAKARAYLKTMGCNYLPTGFVGRVDEKGILYTAAGKELRGTMVGRMEMNPAYDPKADDTYYARIVGDQRGELRTKEFLNRNRVHRHSAVRNFSDNIEVHRKQWIKDLDNKDPKTRVICAIVETIHLTYGRVGTEGNENKGEKTFGIATLRVRQVHVTSQGIKIQYPGKKGTINTHIIKPNSVVNRKVIAIIKSCLAGKTREDRVFSSGRTQIYSTHINRYLRTIGVNVTIHKFRHAAATREAVKMLKDSPFNSRNVPTQAQAERWIKEEAIKIGTLLHHRSGSGDKEKPTSSTAFQAYIDPGLVGDWFTGLGLRIPKWLPEFDES
jgi:hypothetical protein